MMTYPNILLRGLMGVGKTSISHHLANQYGYHRFVIGDLIKQKTFEAYPEIKNLDKVTQRPYVQKVGQKYREIDRDYWLNVLGEAIGATTPALIEDGRPDREASWAQEHGFLVVGLTCDESVRIQRLSDRDGKVDRKAMTDITEQMDHSLSDFVVDTTNRTVDEICEWIVSVASSLTVL